MAVTINESLTGIGIVDGTVTLAQLADVATARILGRTTAGTGVPEAMTGTQSTALLDAMVGDTGSGGTKGLAPAPATGDAAASKFLKADGTWAAAGGALTVGTSAIGSGTATRLLYETAGNVLGEITGATSDGAALTLVAPVLGTPASGTLTNCDGTASSLTSGITAALKSATTTVDVSAAAAPSSGQVLTATAGTTATWQTPAAGGATLGANTLLSGGGIAWVSGLNYIVSSAEYVISGAFYSSPQASVSLTTADGANPRIDIIAVDSAGAAVVIAGTPAATPVAPDVDPATQLRLTFAYVDTSATESSNITTDDIYLENTEWTGSKSGAPIELASTNNPRTSSNCIEGTAAVKDNYFRYTDAAPINPAAWNTLVFHVRSKAAWPSAKSISMQWQLSGANKGSKVALRDGTFAFVSSNSTDYQQIVCPMSLFGLGATSVDSITFTVSGGGAEIGFYVDDIVLQGGITVTAVDSEMMVWFGVWSAATAYPKNAVIKDSGGVAYVALVANTNVTPTDGATWQVVVSGGATLAANTFTGAQTLRAGTTAAGTAPLYMQSGSLLTAAVAGAVEFLTDKLYATITTGAARKEFTLNDTSLTSGRVPYVTTNGRLADSASLLWDNSNARLGIGGSPSEALYVIGSTNAQTAIRVEATNAGTAARASLRLYTDVGLNTVMYATSSAWTTSNMATANQFILATVAKNLLIGVDDTANMIQFFVGNYYTSTTVEILRMAAGVMTMYDGINIAVGTTTGTKIGTAITQKLGFWNVTPVVQQVLATGASATADDIIALLQTLGLCKQS